MKEMRTYKEDPYFYHSGTNTLVLVDAVKAINQGCFMHQTPAFAVLSKDSLLPSCIIATTNRNDGAVHHVNPIYDDTIWTNYWVSFLSREQKHRERN